YLLQIRNISIMVNQLEVYDKNNVLVIRREIAALQKWLEACEKNQTRPNPNLRPANYGKCDHGGIVNISKPFVVQLNWQGFNYKYGGWGSDSCLGADQGMQFVAPLNTDGRRLDILCFYSTYNLLIYSTYMERSLPVKVSSTSTSYTKCGQGGGMIMYNNSLYYNCYNTSDLCKLNFHTNTAEHKTFANAACNNRITFDKMMEFVQSLSYNPNDHKLYMYNDGYLITYDLTFKELK
ncbi:LOW QUALITY PROTEIN: olfactomedin-4-like, partial [Phyllobates terribilis]|uniref:LOW QUALITY PROTEIN: olfactomedin-4-like n=1 Tax=Phyllobates terribilis TaxID=111132 RepID=UPI003CCAE46C